VRRLLERIGLTGCPKTTGGDGMHVYIPSSRATPTTDTRLRRDLATLVIQEKPELFTTPRSVAKRERARCTSTICRTLMGRPSRRSTYHGRNRAHQSLRTRLERGQAGPRPHPVHDPHCARPLRAQRRLIPPVLEKRQALERRSKARCAGPKAIERPRNGFERGWPGFPARSAFLLPLAQA